MNILVLARDFENYITFRDFLDKSLEDHHQIIKDGMSIFRCVVGDLDCKEFLKKYRKEKGYMQTPIKEEVIWSAAYNDKKVSTLMSVHRIVNQCDILVGFYNGDDELFEKFHSQAKNSNLTTYVYDAYDMPDNGTII